MKEEELISKYMCIDIYKEPENRSKLLIGNTTIYNTKHFNWLNRIMFKIFFGIEIVNIRK